MSRVRFARWLLEKLLGSFIVSALFVYGPLLGLRVKEFGIGSVYASVTGVNVGVYLLVYILIPGETMILNRLKGVLKGSKNEHDEIYPNDT